VSWAPALESASRSADAVYLHIDLDSLDPSEGTANEYAAPGGLTRTELGDALATIAGLRTLVAAAALTAYDPDCGPERRVAGTAISIAAEIVETLRVRQ
jgi:arginase